MNIIAAYIKVCMAHTGTWTVFKTKPNVIDYIYNVLIFGGIMYASHWPLL